MRQRGRLRVPTSPDSADERAGRRGSRTRLPCCRLQLPLLSVWLLAAAGVADIAYAQQTPPTSCVRSEVSQTGGLRTISCNRQQLDSVPEVASGIESLLLPNNRIGSLGGRSAAALGRLADSLQELDLSNNYLDDVPPDAFANMTKLRKVDLSRNRLRRMPQGFITSAPYIEELILAKNQFPLLPERFVQGMPRLRRLVLSECSIEEIRPDAFAALAASPLVELDLSANQLEYLDAAVEDDIFTPKLERIRLYDNFWRCDCRLRWLRSTLSKTTVRWTFDGDKYVPHCEEPKRLKHRSWQLSAAEDFGCRPSALEPRQKRLNFFPGTRMTLSCTFDSDPPPTVRWWHDGASLDEAHRYTFSVTQNGSLTTALLSVPSATARDDGQYTCAAASSFGTDNASIVVTVSATANAEVAEAAAGGMHATTIVATAIAGVAVISAVAIGIYCARRRMAQSGTYLNAKDDGFPMLVQSPSAGSAYPTSLGVHNDDYPTAGEQHETSLLYAPHPTIAATSSALPPAGGAAKALARTNDVTPPDVIKHYPDDQSALQEPLLMLGHDAALIAPRAIAIHAPVLPGGTDPVSEYPHDDAGYREYNAYLAMIAEPRAGIAADIQDEAEEEQQEQEGVDASDCIPGVMMPGRGFSTPMIMPVGSPTMADDPTSAIPPLRSALGSASLGAAPATLPTQTRATMLLHGQQQQPPPLSATVTPPPLAHGSMLRTIPEENSI